MMKNLSVLLADDDPDFLEAAKIALEAQGFNVSTASDGEDALQKAKKIKPDLIILDVMMPKKDGYAVCHSIKNDKMISGTPVLILTSLGSAKKGKIGADSMAEGHMADGFLEKPVELEVLTAKVKELVQKIQQNEVKAPKSKILIIDDDPDFVAAVKTVLDGNGYKTVVAYTGEDGLVAVQKENPDMVLLDVMLPQKDGFSVCKELKEDEKTRSIPVIMLTSIAEKLTEPDYARAMAVTHKADDYLEKPVEQKELLKRIQRLIGPRRRLV
jgi:two-component system alkaline phosphatase synthesis response regulator PhoP